MPNWTKEQELAIYDVLEIINNIDNTNKEYDKSKEFYDKYSELKNKKIILYVGKVEERRKPLFCMDVYKEL